MDDPGFRKVPFAPPRIDDAVIEEVTAALRSGWITTGPRVRKFEEALSAYCGASETLCVSSCSAGMELMLRWFGIGPGDEVIVPAYTYSATANGVEHCGAKVVFVDSLPDFSIDVDAVKKAITPRTKAIIPVDIGGWPCDYDALNALIHEAEIVALFSPSNEVQEKLGRILLLSDAAHSLGAQYKEKRTGELADVTVFSFHAVKNLTTAEGGAVCLHFEAFDNAELYKRLRILSLHGQTKDALAKTKAGGWRYDIIEPGYKFNMTDIQAAIGLVELARYEDDMLVRRKEIFDRYTEAFASYDWAIIPQTRDAHRISSYHVYMLRIAGCSEQQRDAIMDEIAKRGVAVNVHFVPLPLMSYYGGNGYLMDDYPQAFKNYAAEISLPVFYDLSHEDQDWVIKAVSDSVAQVLGI